MLEWMDIQPIVARLYRGLLLYDKLYYDLTLVKCIHCKKSDPGKNKFK